MLAKKNLLPDRESNPGLPRDRRRSSPLDYRGIDVKGVSNRFQTYAPGQKHILSAASAHGSPWQDFVRHRWFSGRMLACHAGGPGSIPGRCKVFEAFPQKDAKKKNSGDAGYRSPYLSHAKRALYHLSYVPKLWTVMSEFMGVSGYRSSIKFPPFSVGRPVGCSCSMSEIQRWLVQIRSFCQYFWLLCSHA